MAISEKKAAVNDDISTFSDLVDETCEQLMDRQVKYSIRKIHEMEGRIAGLEQELDAFLVQKKDTE